MAWIATSISAFPQTTLQRVLVYHPAETPPAIRFLYDSRTTTCNESSAAPAQLAAGSLLGLRLAQISPGGGVCPYVSFQCLDPTLASVKVQSAVTGETFDAIITSPSDAGCSQSLQAQLPSNVPLGGAEVTLVYDDATLPPAAIDVVISHFGILGPISNAAGELLRLAHPAAPESVIRVTGTGLGQAVAGSIYGELDGQPLTFLRSSQIAGSPGMDALLFQLPGRLQVEGCYTPVAVRVEDRWTSSVAAAVSQTGGPCKHPLDLTAGQLESLDNGRSIALGILTAHSTPYSRVINATFQFAGREAVALASFSDFAEGCRIGVSATPQPSSSPVMLASGAKSTVRLPDGGINPLPFYSRPLLTAGDYSVAVSGGKDVLPAGVNFRLPQLPRTAQELPFPLSGEILLEWDPSPFSEAELVTVTAYTFGESYSLDCKTRARNGSMRLPVKASADPPSATGIRALLSFYFGVERRKNLPLLFPFQLTNGASFQGLVDYQFGEPRFIALRGPAQ